MLSDDIPKACQCELQGNPAAVGYPTQDLSLGSPVRHHLTNQLPVYQQWSRTAQVLEEIPRFKFCNIQNTHIVHSTTFHIKMT